MIIYIIIDYCLLQIIIYFKNIIINLLFIYYLFIYLFI